MQKIGQAQKSLAILPAHELVFFTMFHNNFGSKLRIFLLLYFWASPLFLHQSLCFQLFTYNVTNNNFWCEAFFNNFFYKISTTLDIGSYLYFKNYLNSTEKKGLQSEAVRPESQIILIKNTLSKKE